MKFTDLNFDCLEIVLEYLNLIDLLNVADTSKRLNKAAELVFARENGNKNVTFGNTRILRHRSFKITHEEIYIDDLKTSLQLLRCVGRVVSKIKFNKLTSMVENQAKLDDQLVTYTNRYCAEYLNQVECSYVCCSRNSILYFFDFNFPKFTRLLDEYNKSEEINIPYKVLFVELKR